MTTTPVSPALDPSTAAAGQERAIQDLLRGAARQVAPLWPLSDFVAVNPYLDLAAQPFEQADGWLRHIADSRLTMPRAFYANAIRDGRIDDLDLAQAWAAWPPSHSEVESLQALRERAGRPEPQGEQPFAHVADAASAWSGDDWAQIVVDRLSAWCCDYFDEGQALWRSPWTGLPLFDAWRHEALQDRTPEILGLKGFRSAIAGLPRHWPAATRHMLDYLSVPETLKKRYLTRLAMSAAGWIGHARYRAWVDELAGKPNDAPEQLLAIRLAWDYALYRALERNGFAEVWSRSLENESGREPATDWVGLLLHQAYEGAYQRRLLQGLSPRPSAGVRRASVQAIFCIDVRSEVFRRHLEAASGRIDTIGFAGFFGFPVAFAPLGSPRTSALCPVLLSPAATAVERAPDAARESSLRLARRRREYFGKLWKSFKGSAVACFGFVGPVGWIYAFKMLGDALGWSRPAPLSHFTDREQDALKPALSPLGSHEGHPMAASAQTEMAEGALRAMSLTSGFARLVLVAGHGSTSVNNAYAAGLDCGACGGHSGAMNARIAAQVFNDPGVRQGLAERGITIPDDTVFVAGLHNTTTDELTLLDTGAVPDTHATDLRALQDALAEAGEKTRRERAPRLGVQVGPSTRQEVLRRSTDWSQMRPEWALAGCAAFLAAPRHRSRGLDLGGRVFLHDYDWRQDPSESTLTLILTAPVVVASWINLQYFGSTVDPVAFGSGNKALQNVTGAIGVLEGNAGDLRSGLPWQSVHDGARFVHEPVRLSVIVEAPQEAVDRVLEANPSVRQLVENRWLHLFLMDEAGRVSRQCRKAGHWVTLPSRAATTSPS